MTIRLTNDEIEEIDGFIDFFESESDEVSCFTKIKNIVEYKKHIEDIDSDDVLAIREELCNVNDFFESINIDTGLIKRLIYSFSII